MTTKFFVVGSSLDELLEIVTLTIAKRNVCEKQSHSVSAIHYLASGDTLEDLKFINALSPQSI
jgi:hypothetical protein